MSKLFKMPTWGNETLTPGTTDEPVFRSGETHPHSIGPGISEIMLPDGSIVNVDPQGNILKDIVD